MPDQLLHTVLAAALVLAQQDGAEHTVDQELDALIDKTNALESFHAVYRAETLGADDDEPRAGRLELAYGAPDRGRVHLEADEGDMDLWWLEKHVAGHFVKAGEDEHWFQADFPDPPPARELLDSLFPVPEKALGPGLLFILDWEGMGEDKFNLSLNFQPEGRSCLLAWLGRMKRKASEIEIDGEHLISSGDGYRCSLSRQSGFPDRIELEKSDGKKAVFVLEELQLDQELDGELFLLPEEAASAPEEEGVAKGFAGLYSPGVLRQTAFLRVESQLRSELREWNERTRQDWRDVLGALHRDLLTRQYSPWIDELRESIDQFAEHIRSDLKEDPSSEHRNALREHADEFGSKLSESLDSALERYRDELPALDSGPEPPREELFEIEREVAGELFDELVRAPLQAYLAEQLDAAFGD